MGGIARRITRDILVTTMTVTAVAMAPTAGAVAIAATLAVAVMVAIAGVAAITGVAAMVPTAGPAVDGLGTSK